MKKLTEMITAKDIAVYWEEKGNEKVPFLGETLFSNRKTIGMELEWVKGANNTPVALKPAAFDTKATLRDRRGIERVKTEMAFFRESMVLKEKDRQQLMQFQKMNDSNLMNMVLKNLYDDKSGLIEGARVQNERMIMQLLATGTIGIEANEQKYEYDYGMPASHKFVAIKDWSDPTADIFGEVLAAQRKIKADTGATLTRAICNSTVWAKIANNTAIRNELIGNTNLIVGDEELRAWFKKKLNISIAVYDKVFEDESGVTRNYYEGENITFLPEGTLGELVFGTTPEEADAMYNSAANVAITNTGVAVTSIVKVDPVSVQTIVSMISLPSFPRINEMAIIDTKPAGRAKNK
ncbi:MAG: major capsid protein [Fusobacteriaceae bacterium]